MKHRRVAAWIGIIAAAAIMVAGAADVLRWTLIPIALDARVVDTSYSDSTTGHLRTLTFDDGRTIVITRSFLEAAGGDGALRGEVVRKDRLDRQLHVGRRSVDLPVPFDIWRTLAALAVPLLVGCWLREAARRSTRLACYEE